MNTSEKIESRQYLTFRMDQEVFALDIMNIREILELKEITKVPQTPEFMCGVINLRGSVVPIVDLRLKFGMGQTEKTVHTCVVILEVEMDGDVMVLGCLADSVQEVIDLGSDQIEPAPKLGAQLETKFIRGIGRWNDEFVMILDVDNVFSTDELGSIKQ
jgi:purine-binding chemotaxis protein CheW